MTKLTIERTEPKSGKINNIVIFLHGYGANGKDLLNLSEHMNSSLRDTLFLAPNGPQPCPINPEGFQWFSLPTYDGSTAIEVGKTLQQSLVALDGLISETIKEHDVDPKNIALVGFSQGTMLALEYAPKCSYQLAAVVGFSGRILFPYQNEKDIKFRPPVLLVHDRDDPVVPYSELTSAEKNLTGNGFKVYTYSSTGSEHSISPVGLGVGLHFLVRELNV